MPPIVKDLFLSKKFLVALITAVGTVTAYFGWNVDPTALLAVATPFLIYIGAQGWADSGKEKAKIDAAAAIQIHTMAMQQGARFGLNNAMQDDQKPSVTVVQVTKEGTP